MSCHVQHMWMHVAYACAVVKQLNAKSSVVRFEFGFGASGDVRGALAAACAQSVRSVCPLSPTRWWLLIVRRTPHATWARQRYTLTRDPGGAHPGRCGRSGLGTLTQSATTPVLQLGALGHSTKAHLILDMLYVYQTRYCAPSAPASRLRFSQCSLATMVSRHDSLPCWCPCPAAACT